MLNDGDVEIVESSITLTLNGTEISPAVSKSGGVTTVSYTNPDGFFPGGDHVAVLSYDEGSDPVITRVFNHNFNVPSGQSIVLLDNPFAYWADYLMPVALLLLCLCLAHKTWPHWISRLSK